MIRYNTINWFSCAKSWWVASLICHMEPKKQSNEKLAYHDLDIRVGWGWWEYCRIHWNPTPQGYKVIMRGYNWMKISVETSWEGLPLEYSCVWLRNKRNQWQILSSTKSWQLFTNMDSILLTVGWFASMFTRFFDTAELCLYSFSWEIGWKQILVVLLRWREFEARSVAVFLLTCHRGGGGRCQSQGC